MSDAHEKDEWILKKIVKRTSTCVQENNFLDAIIYYKSPKRLNYTMKNKHDTSPTLKLTNVIYNFNSSLKTAGFNLMSITMVTQQQL